MKPFLVIQIITRAPISVDGVDAKFTLALPYVTNNPDPFLAAGAQILHNNGGVGYESEADGWEAYANFSRHVELTKE
jgi:hypothetical protein